MSGDLGHIEALNDIGDVLRYAADVCKAQGVIRYSYHLTPIFDAPNSANTTVIAEGYSKEWLALYDRSDFRAKDPIPRLTLQLGELLTWKDAIATAPDRPEHQEYFAAMREFGLVHGFGLPLFGPRGRNAFASFDFGKPLSEVDEGALEVVRIVPQAGHQRVCVLIDRARDVPELTEREEQVLSWVAKGKSFSVIAEILELSPDTVKTYTKRLYAKLGTNDRVGAVVKALQLGLVSL